MKWAMSSLVGLQLQAQATVLQQVHTQRGKKEGREEGRERGMEGGRDGGRGGGE